MLQRALATSVLLLLPAGVSAQATQSKTPAYPPIDALEAGVSPDALARLGALAQELVDDDEIVGAELLVIKEGRTLLHEGYGWRDREREEPMSPGGVFCVRSMTKPLIGTAILMLEGEGLLELDDPVSKHLDYFDTDELREITIEQLLTHTSGLPLSLLLGGALKTVENIQEVAALAVDQPLDFAPGEAFQYSDQGTDTLTAVIEVASGLSAADFVRTRILEPLGMHDSACELSLEHPLRPRVCSMYVGSRDSWNRFWKPDEESIFPCFLGSQGLYSTLEDYAHFLELWLERGRVNGERLLKSRLVRKALRPGPHPVPFPTALPELHGDYGFLMQVFLSLEEGQEREDGELVAFGHSGSDGTWAWAFPEQEALVLFFTQSRGNNTGLRMEEVLGELLLGAPFDPNQLAPPFDDYLGYYWEGEGDIYRAIVRRGDEMALEVIGRAVVPLVYAGEDRWKLRPNPSVVLEFQRDEAGRVSGYRMGEQEEFRFTPSPELPSAAELAQRVAETHGLARLEELGGVRLSGKLVGETLKLEGTLAMTLAWPNSYRYDTRFDENFESVAFDGSEVRYVSVQSELATLEGDLARSARLDNYLIRFGDWRGTYPDLQVIQRLMHEEEPVYLVRSTGTDSIGITFFVHGPSGRLVQEYGVWPIETIGEIGQKRRYGDFREVQGMLLPHRSQVDYAHGFLGTFVATIEEVEVGLELSEGYFQLAD